MGFNLEKKKEVLKHSSAIQISNKVNLLQRRSWNILLANAFDDLECKEEYEISVKNLCPVLNYNSHNDEHLKIQFPLRTMRRGLCLLNTQNY